MSNGLPFHKKYMKEKLQNNQINLDEQQRQVVSSEDKNIIVCAGAGAGKTRILTERVKYLLEEKKVSPESLVAITFTNIASEEIKSRLVEVEGVEEAFIGTIHSFANKILREKSGNKYTLLTEDLKDKLIIELLEKFPCEISPSEYQRYAESMKLFKLGVRTDHDNLPQKCVADLETLIEDDYIDLSNPFNLKSLCKKRNIITFDELILKTKNYCQRENFSLEYLLVDEFQDISNEEFNFLTQGLQAKNNFFVGDDWQAIYGFKGGNFKIFQELSRNLIEPYDFKTYFLKNNYRNSSSVNFIANQVISKISDKIPKEVKLLNRDREKGKVSLIAKNSFDYFLQDTFKSNKNDLKDWFILTRTNKEVAQLLKILDRQGIPAITFKRESMTFFDLEARVNENKIKIMTVHTAKGLEAKNVIIYTDFRERLQKDTETRVFYVALTRCIENLYLCTDVLKKNFIDVSKLTQTFPDILDYNDFLDTAKALKHQLQIEDKTIEKISLPNLLNFVEVFNGLDLLEGCDESFVKEIITKVERQRIADSQREHEEIMNEIYSDWGQG